MAGVSHVRFYASEDPVFGEFAFQLQKVYPGGMPWLYFTESGVPSGFFVWAVAVGDGVLFDGFSEPLSGGAAP